ncbi:conserved hypothetical protein [Candida tropicalis MYA-3404]|uniref:Bromo domain-containing protein n=1 Tax=Candida tropicalis (strain ATCC MYA-3404 / T1) TaxID=294747 RepID=C5M5L8_CANTT|nr:conserved hypothetical protein [Candida tropicalis MYA-3404]EER34288.1 conserved hypothetical protein [Candida tropicalis MYA-3404]KAG4408154.1 hypothetical protein JTP64_001460 [Candida tropicalis]
MATKRRQSASSETTPVKKLKKETFNHTPEEYKEFFNSTLDLVFHLKDGDEELSAIFVKLPSKKFYSDYYHIVKQPISLNEIQKRIKNKYTAESADEFLDDFELLLNNAKTYNAPDSWIVASATKIVNFVKDQVKEFENTPSKSLSSVTTAATEAVETPDQKKPRIKLKLKQRHEESIPEVNTQDSEPHITFGKLAELCLEVLNDVVNHDFPDIGVISEPFLEEVDTDFYSDYLDYVSKPMSFNTIISNLERKKLLSPKYPLLDNLQKFHDTTTLIFDNAKAYNNEGSQIYQDAVLLEEYFNEKYSELKHKVEKDGPKQAQSMGPKLKLNLGKANAATVSTPKRKRKAVLKIEPEETPEVVDDVHDDQVEVDQAEKDNEGNAEEEDDSNKEVGAEQDIANTLGKSLPLLPESNAIIQESALFSSPAVASNVTKFVQQKFSTPATIIPREKEIKKGLFPTHQTTSVATLFSYKVPSNGYTNQSYTVALPNGVSPFVSFKVSLHNLLYEAKKRDLIDDHGLLNQPANEEFHCKLSVNEEEVTGVVDCFKEEKGSEDVLGVQYDVRLSYGLNVLTFDCKVAPALSKKIKNTVIEEEEIAGRHTRHQLQQMQKTWDVETITFYVVCNSG